MSQINNFEKRVMSQNGEDGIIEEIFHRIGTESKRFVEFGVETGIQCNTAYLAKNKGWSGLMIEGSPSMYQVLKNNYAGCDVKVVNSFVTAENIAELFASNGIPKEFDLLSIDIDGNDYWVWKALSEYKPRVIVIEYNPIFPPNHKWVIRYNPNHVWDGTSYYGASLESLNILGEKLGYSLVGTDSIGVNAFFIRSDIVEKSGLPELSTSEAYHPAKYYGHMNGCKFGHPFKNGEHEEI